MKIIEVPIKKLKPAEYNPRTMTKLQEKDLTASIKKFGLVDPIIVNKHKNRLNVVIGGHQRLKIAQQQGFTTIPVHYVDLDEKNERELNLRLNKNNAEWDWDALKEFDKDLLQLVGFEDKDLLKYFPTEIVEDEALEPPTESKSKLGDLYQLGNHRLLCGDATKKEDVEWLMDGQKADMVFTSPPYNLGDNVALRGPLASNKKKTYTEYDDNVDPHQWAELMMGFIESWRPVSQYQFVNVQMLAGNKQALIEWLAINGSHVADIAVWDKTHAPPMLAEQVMSSQFEFVVILSSEENPSRAITIAPKFRGTVNNVLSLAPNKPKADENHGAVFPVQFPAHYVQHFTVDNAVVADPFGGSGSTLIACEQLNRKCYMMEIDPKYVDVIIERWEKFSGNKAKKI